MSKLIGILQSFFLIQIMLVCNAQETKLNLALSAMERITETYENKTKNLQFKVLNTYRFSCSDSIIAQEELTYMVKNGEYFIQSTNIDFVMSRSFFVMVDHAKSRLVYASEPPLEYQDLSNKKYLKEIREHLLNDAGISFDTNGNEITIKAEFIGNYSNKYSEMTFTYDLNYYFKSIRYIESSAPDNSLFQLPNCLTIEYFSEDPSKIKKNAFKLSTYLNTHGNKISLSKEFESYSLIEQKKPSYE